MKEGKYFSMRMLLFGIFMIGVYFSHKNLPGTADMIIATMVIIVGIILVIMGVKKIIAEKKKDS